MRRERGKEGEHGADEFETNTRHANTQYLRLQDGQGVYEGFWNDNMTVLYEIVKAEGVAAEK